MRYRLACSAYVIIAEQRMLSIANRPLCIRVALRSRPAGSA